MFHGEIASQTFTMLNFYSGSGPEIQEIPSNLGCRGTLFITPEPGRLTEEAHKCELKPGLHSKTMYQTEPSMVIRACDPGIW